MFESLLVANRGEIACRIMRTAKRLGLRTIAVYSDADRSALHVSAADVAVRLGPAPARQSYLNQGALLAAAVDTSAQALHPGYGFLAENAQFAQACEAAGIRFVGPPSPVIRAMGQKAEAKAMMTDAGVPVLPGYEGERQDVETLSREADALGYPVMIKAQLGGGGKGMRLVRDPSDFASSLESARREAAASFGDDSGAVGEGRRPAETRGGAGIRGSSRERRALVRAGLFRAAPTPEGHRGGAGSGSR